MTYSKFIKVPLELVSVFNNKVDLLLFCYFNYSGKREHFFTNDYLAEFLGVSARTISRSVKRLEKDKLLSCVYFFGEDGITKHRKIKMEAFIENEGEFLIVKPLWHNEFGLDYASCVILAFLVSQYKVTKLDTVQAKSSDLQETFNVSKNTLDKSIMLLEALGFISKSNKGRYGRILRLEDKSLLEANVESFTEEHKEVLEIVNYSFVAKAQRTIDKVMLSWATKLYKKKKEFLFLITDMRYS